MEDWNLVWPFDGKGSHVRNGCWGECEEEEG